MIGSSISAHLRKARSRVLVGATCAAAVTILLAPAAQAQGLFSLFEPQPQRIERQLEGAGYELRRPVMRRGDVYVADVVDETGRPERLVIDARTARIVERFPGVASHWREDRYGDWRDRDAEDAWSAAPRPLQGMALRPRDDAWLNGDDEDAPVLRPKPRDEVARTDPSAKPNVIYGEDGLNGPLSPTGDIDKSKPKPHVAKKKPAPVAKAAPSGASTPDAAAPSPANLPGAESAKPLSPPTKGEADTPKSVVDAKPEAKPVVEAKPSEMPATEPKSMEAKQPATESKPVAEAKAATPPQPPVRAEKKAKAVNDVPVNPLD